MRFALVPPSGRGDVLLQRPVPLQALLRAREAQGLDGHPQRLLETDRIRQMPAVQPETQLAVIELIGRDDLRHPQVGRAVRLVPVAVGVLDRKSTRLNSSHVSSSYAVFC